MITTGNDARGVHSTQGHSAGHPDELIKTIPDVDLAIAEFNSVPAQAPPFRDIPSILLHLVRRPDLSVPEPNWEALLYYLSTDAPRGLENLQDFYLLVVRVVIPNLIITNRRYMHVLYARLPTLPVRSLLRYDSWRDTVGGRTNPAMINVVVPASDLPPGTAPQSLALTYHVAPRAIFRSRMTPDGHQLRRWLATSPLPLAHGPTETVPSQMVHRTSELDEHLTFAENQLRALSMGKILRRTIRALNIFWWLSQTNAKFEVYRVQSWVGVGAETY